MIRGGFQFSIVCSYEKKRFVPASGSVVSYFTSDTHGLLYTILGYWLGPAHGCWRIGCPHSVGVVQAE